LPCTPSGVATTGWQLPLQKIFIKLTYVHDKSIHLVFIYQIGGSTRNSWPIAR
jgi:hypothetical protein